MPIGHRFFVYTQPPSDVLLWSQYLTDPERMEHPEVGQEEVVRSWKAWGNSPTSGFVVTFELDERSALFESGCYDRHYNVDDINAALVGPISVYEVLRA